MRIFKNLMIIFMTCLMSITAFTQEIDLLEMAEKAVWRNTDNTMLAFGRDLGAVGHAKYEMNKTLEDGISYPKVLFTHPQWRNNGTIVGTFADITIPNNQPRIVIAGGFGEGAQGSDGVKFVVAFAGSGAGSERTRVRSGSASFQSMCDFQARFDGKIDRKECSLEQFSGRTGNVIVMVDAGNSADSDWAMWTEIKILSGDVAVNAQEAEGKPVQDKELVNTMRAHSGRIYHVQFSHDGQSLVSSSADRTARIWKVPSGDPVTVLSGHGAHVFSAGFNPNNRRVITASGDKTARVWQIPGGSQVMELRGHTEQVLAAAYKSDGGQMATGGDDGMLKLWNVSNGEEIRSITIAGGGVYSVAYSPNGRMIAVGSTNGGLVLYEASSGRQVRTFDGHRRAVYNIVFSRNGQFLASASVDNTAKVWKTQGGLVKNFGGRAFYSAALNSDGSILVTGNDGMAVVWNVEQGKQIMTLKHASDAAVRGVAVSPNNRFVAMGGEDNAVRIWKVDLK